LAQLGDWSLGSSQHPPSAGQQPRACTVTLLDGIRARVPASVSVAYAPGCSLSSSDTSELPAALAACADADQARTANNHGTENGTQAIRK